MVVIALFIDANSEVEVAREVLQETVVTSKYVSISKKRPFVHRAT